MVGMNGVNTVILPTSKDALTRTVERISRRRWLTLATGAAAELAAVGVWAAEPVSPIVVGVGNSALGALVVAVGGAHVRVDMASEVAGDSLRIESRSSPVTERILLKGKGNARTRFLDDARNATRVADNIQAILARAVPSRAGNFAEARRTWAREFARSVFDWSQRLQKSPLRGQTVRDEHGRVYLLEWAGAKVDPRSKSPGPAALKQLPAAPAQPTVVAYRAYLDALVSALL
jgi:hypothetical protein